MGFFSPLFLSPILVFDDSINDFLHLFSERKWVGGELLSRRTTAFLRLLDLLVLIPSAATAGTGRGRATVMITVSLALSGCLLVTHFLFNVL